MKIQQMPCSLSDDIPEELQDTDKDLVALWAQVRDDDHLAFESVYAVCSGAIFGLCLRMTANRAAAEDCLQATFIAAWEKRASFRSESRLSTWLHRIAINAVLGRGRSEGRRQEVMDQYSELAPAGQSFSEDLFGAGVDIDLERAIADLPERSRQVFVLHAIHGYKHNEVGEMMGIAAGTSKAHYHRSRELLQASLTADSQEALCR